MSEAPQTGGLLFTILCAEKRIWNVRDVSNLYLFEHALLAVPTTLGEMVEGASKKRTPEEWDAWLAGKRSAG